MNEILDDAAWMNKVTSIQRSGGQLKTSASQQSSTNLDATTFSVSEYMQGSALYAPDSMAYDIIGKNVENAVSTLSADTQYGQNFSNITKEMLPFNTLQAQVAGGSVNPSVAQTTAGSGSGKTPVPPELQKYGNGKIPPELLVPIGYGSHRLYEAAAVMFRSMSTAWKADGINTGVTDSYRSYSQQVAIDKNFDGIKDGTAGTPAAIPGTSNHGWGLAVDLALDGGNNFTSKGYVWMQNNASKFGFVNPDWAKPVNLGGKDNSGLEPWHWEYRGDLTIRSGSTVTVK